MKRRLSIISDSDFAPPICRKNYSSAKRCSASRTFRAATFVRPMHFVIARCATAQVLRANKSVPRSSTARPKISTYGSPEWVRKENSRTSAGDVQQPLSAPQDAASALRERLIAPQEHHEPFRFQFADDDSTEAVDNTFLNYFRAEDSRRFGSRGGKRFFIGSLVVLLLVAIFAVSFYRDAAKQVFAALGASLADIAGAGKPQSPTTETLPITPYELPRQPASPPPLPTAELPSALSDDPQTTVTPPSKFEAPVLPPHRNHYRQTRWQKRKSSRRRRHPLEFRQRPRKRRPLI